MSSIEFRIPGPRSADLDGGQPSHADTHLPHAAAPASEPAAGDPDRLMVLVEELGFDQPNALGSADAHLNMGEMAAQGLLALGFLGMMEYERGQLRSAQVLAAEGLKIARHRGWSGLAQASLVHLVPIMVDLERNRLGEAQRLLDARRSPRQRALTPAVRIAMHVAQARLDLACGRTDRARTLLKRLRSSVDGARPPVLVRRWLTVTEAETDLAAGSPSTALERVRSFPHGMLGTPERLRLVAARAELVLGHTQQAEAILAPLRESSTNPVVAAEAWLVSALAADRLRNDHDALVALDRALLLAEQQDAPRPFLAVDDSRLEAMLGHRQRLSAERRPFADNLLAQLDASKVAAVPESRLADPLTQREQMVLRHLATLQSHEEIGAELFISVNTVKAHAKSVYQKLAVSRRRDAVSQARALGLL